MDCKANDIDESKESYINCAETLLLYSASDSSVDKLSTNSPDKTCRARSNQSDYLVSSDDNVPQGSLAENNKSSEVLSGDGEALQETSPARLDTKLLTTKSSYQKLATNEICLTLVTNNSNKTDYDYGAKEQFPNVDAGKFSLSPKISAANDNDICCVNPLGKQTDSANPDHIVEVKNEALPLTSKPNRQTRKRTKGIQCLVDHSKDEFKQKTHLAEYGISKFKTIKSKTMRRINDFVCVQPKSHIYVKGIIGFICGVILVTVIYIVLYYSNRSNSSQTQTTNEDFADRLPLLWTIYVGLGIGLLWGFGMAFAMNIRCITLLLLPSLCTTRGRTVLAAIFVQIIISGPVTNTVFNAQQVPLATSCQMELLINKTKQLEEEFHGKLRNMSEKYKDIVGSALESPIEMYRRILAAEGDIKQKLKQFSSSFSIEGIMIGGEFINMTHFRENINLPEVLIKLANTEIWTALSPIALIHAAKEKIGYLLTNFKYITQMFQHVMPFTIAVLVIQATMYYRGYKNKLSYDNKYITGMFKKLDQERKQKNQKYLLPLRRTETTRYVDSTSLKLTGREFTSLSLGIILSMILGFFGLLAFVVDLAFYHLLNVLQDYNNNTMSIKGGFVMGATLPEEDFSPEIRRGIMNEMPHLFKTYDMTFYEEIETNKCNIELFEPKFNVPAVINMAIIFWVAILLLNLVGAYLLRFQHCFASYFYPEIAQKRVEYLYDQIRIRRLTLRDLLLVNKDGDNVEPTRTQIIIAKWPELASKLIKFGLITKPICDVCGGEEHQLKHLGDDTLVCELCLKNKTLKTINFVN